MWTYVFDDHRIMLCHVFLTQNIENKHQFIFYHTTKGDIVLKYVDTSNQISEVFTKPL